MLWDVSVNDEWFRGIEMPTRPKAEVEGCRRYCEIHDLNISPSRLLGLSHAHLQSRVGLLKELSKVTKGGQTNV